MNFKKIFATVLSTAVIAGSMSVCSVSARSYAYNSGSYHVGIEGTGDEYVGGIYIAGQLVTDTYYNVDEGLFSTKVRTIDHSCSGTLMHSAGVYSNGTSKWTSDSTTEKLKTSKVKTYGYANIMALAYN